MQQLTVTEHIKQLKIMREYHDHAQNWQIVEQLDELIAKFEEYYSS